MKQKIEFYKHNLDKKDKYELNQVLNSIFLTTGDLVKKFESDFANYFNVKFCVGVTSCTEALFLSLKGLGISSGDEVITTPLSFIASANAIEYCKAKPVFVDVDEKTGLINPDLIENKINFKTKAILVVHLYGQMCDMKKIKKIANKYKLKIIEDCAHCIEGERDGIKPGQLSDAACFSFYATKNLTSGEGGAIITNNSSLNKWLTKARQHGMSKSAIDRYSKRYEHYDMDFLGYKANMTNLQAALLINQLKRLDKLLIRKEIIAKQYDKGFSTNNEIQIPIVLPNTKHARHLYTILVDSKIRDELIMRLQDKKIGVAVNFRPIHLMKYYRRKYDYKKGDFPVTEKIGASTISIPFYQKLKTNEIKYIIDCINTLTKSPKALSK